jgi:peptidyl-prolyl cis-trans isomerase SurA
MKSSLGTSMEKQLSKLGIKAPLLSAIMLAGAAMSQPAYAADDVQRIIAVVNDAVVSDYDISERVGLIMATTGDVSSEEQFKQLRTNVLEMLVDEALQLQEAFEKELPLEMESVEQRYAQLAASNNVSVEQFDASLEQMGASKISILSQMRAALAWEEVVDSQLRPFLAISETEVNSYQDRMTQNKGAPEYRIAEIFLSVKSSDREAETLQTAERLKEQVRAGANFAEVARQFSETPTGAAGGDMGWMLAEQVNASIREAVVSMPEGGLVGPIRSSGGYALYTLIDKRRVMMADMDQTKLNLQQIVVPLNDRNPNELAAAIQGDTGRISRCKDIPAFATMVGARDYGSLGELKLGDLPRELKTLVEPVKVGHATPPVKMGGDMRVLIVCGRTDPEFYEPSYVEIEDFLTNQRLAMMSRRYMRDLRRDAIIDYR